MLHTCQSLKTGRLLNVPLVLDKGSAISTDIVSRTKMPCTVLDESGNIVYIKLEGDILRQYQASIQLSNDLGRREIVFGKSGFMPRVGNGTEAAPYELSYAEFACVSLRSHTMDYTINITPTTVLLHDIPLERRMIPICAIQLTSSWKDGYTTYPFKRANARILSSTGTVPLYITVWNSHLRSHDLIQLDRTLILLDVRRSQDFMHTMQINVDLTSGLVSAPKSIIDCFIEKPEPFGTEVSNIREDKVDKRTSSTTSQDNIKQDRSTIVFPDVIHSSKDKETMTTVSTRTLRPRSTNKFPVKITKVKTKHSNKDIGGNCQGLTSTEDDSTTIHPDATLLHDIISVLRQHGRMST